VTVARTRVGDLGDTPWWANAPTSLAAVGTASCALSIGHLQAKVVAWLSVVAAVSFAVSLSRRVHQHEERPSIDRRLRPAEKRSASWLAVHALMIGAGVAPFLFWARGGVGADAMTLVATTAAAIGLLFGTRSGLTISIACSAGVLALSLAGNAQMGVWSFGVGVPFWLAGLSTILILMSCAFIARLGLAELATGPNVPVPFSAPPTDKRGVGLFQPPGLPAMRAAALVTAGCVLVALLLEPFVSPLTQRVSQSASDRLTGSGSAAANAAKGTIFKGASGRDQSSSQVLGANDSFTIDNFGATSDAEVLRVSFNVGKELFRQGAKVPQSALLKGQSFDKWDGKRWFNTAEVVKQLQPMEPTFPPEQDPTLAGDIFLSRVQVMRGSTSLIFGPSRIVQVDLSDQQLLLREDDSVVTSDVMGPGTEYLVVTAKHSFRDDAPDVAREMLANSGQDLLVHGVRPEHLDVSTMSKRSLALAGLFGTNEPSIQGVGRNIEKWLSTNTTYDFSARHSTTSKSDVVDQFLFETNAGWCEQIATSTVMLLRANGIPARLATGYLPSAIDANGTFSVLGRDAHAWVEYYLPGYGWAQLDPTQKVPVAKLPPTRTDRSISSKINIWLIGALVGSALVGLVIALGRRNRRNPQLTEVDRRIEQLQDFGTRHDRARKSHETLTEFGASLDAKLGAEHQPVQSVVELLEQDRFGSVQHPGTLTEADKLLSELAVAFPPPTHKQRRQQRKI
jgi:hypothetical protein